MPTIINNPPPQNSDGGGTGFLMGILVLVAVLIVLGAVGLPVLRSYTTRSTSPQINVPGQIDVNLKQQK